jgi:hypothetical protein
LFVRSRSRTRWDARLTIDGRTVELRKAYRPSESAKTFVGFYADVDAGCGVITFDSSCGWLPVVQGVFFENVEQSTGKDRRFWFWF